MRQLTPPFLEIKQMQPEDAARAAALERLVFPDPWTEEGFLSILQKEYALYLVARVKGESEIAGCCGLLQSLDEAEILNVAVRPGLQKKGVGYAMLSRLMELGRARRIERFTLEVRSSNAAARHLYEKLGFFSVGVRKHFYQNPVEDAVILWTRGPEEPHH